MIASKVCILDTLIIIIKTAELEETLFNLGIPDVLGLQNSQNSWPARPWAFYSKNISGYKVGDHCYGSLSPAPVQEAQWGIKLPTSGTTAKCLNQ